METVSRWFYSSCIWLGLMMRVPQPTPTVTAADVERVARRDFPEEQMPVVMEVLGEYGNEHREVNRVRLAALKLANRKLPKLRYWIEQAECDYRDVLGPAEYPLYGKQWGRIDKMSEDEQEKIIQADWAQYENWLNG